MPDRMDEVPTLEAVAERIREFLLAEGAWHSGREKLTDDASLLTGALDSVTIVDLVALLESEFGIVVENDDLDPEHFGSIRSIVALVERKRRS
jgi:acyl carrier protein